MYSCVKKKFASYHNMYIDSQSQSVFLWIGLQKYKYKLNSISLLSLSLSFSSSFFFFWDIVNNIFIISWMDDIPRRQSAICLKNFDWSYNDLGRQFKILTKVEVCVLLWLLVSKLEYSYTRQSWYRARNPNWQSSYCVSWWLWIPRTSITWSRSRWEWVAQREKCQQHHPPGSVSFLKR